MIKPLKHIHYEAEIKRVGLLNVEQRQEETEQRYKNYAGYRERPFPPPPVTLELGSHSGSRCGTEKSTTTLLSPSSVEFTATGDGEGHRQRWLSKREREIQRALSTATSQGG